jgi:uncharacterized protein (TIRG00374 family)
MPPTHPGIILDFGFRISDLPPTHHHPEMGAFTGGAWHPDSPRIDVPGILSGSGITEGHAATGFAIPEVRHGRLRADDWCYPRTDGEMVVLLAVFLWNVDFKEVGQSLAGADLQMLIAASLVALFAYWLRGLRWQFILRPVGHVRHSSVLLTTAVGYAALSLLPARMGDLIRPLLLARREKIPASASLASILTERVFDLWSVVLFFLVFIIWPPQMSNLDKQAQRSLEILSLSGYVVGAGLLIGTGILLGLFRYQERFVELLTRPVGWIRTSWRQPVTNFLNHFLDGLRVLQRPRDLIITTAASVFMWYVICWQVRFTLLAFDIDLPLRAAYLIVTMAVIGLAVPTPGGVGGFHKATQVGMTLFFGIGLNEATGIAIAYHAICFVPITIIGLLCLPLLGVNLREVESVGPEAAEE